MYEFKKMEYDDEIVGRILGNKIVQSKIEEMAYRMAEKIERILEQVIKDNPDIPMTNMTLRCNLNYVPIDVISKDGEVLYSFEKEYLDD